MFRWLDDFREFSLSHRLVLGMFSEALSVLCELQTSLLTGRYVGDTVCRSVATRDVTAFVYLSTAFPVFRGSNVAVGVECRGEFLYSVAGGSGLGAENPNSLGM
jgi:hypothetical protein